MPHNTAYLVPAWVVDEIKAYLAGRPYNEVFRAMTALQCCKKVEETASQTNQDAKSEAQ